MRALARHLEQAHYMATRLKGVHRRADAFERALDWLTDGAALLRKDGRALYSNEAFETIARRNDGLRLTRGAIELAAPEARARFAAALAATCRLHGSDPRRGSTPTSRRPRDRRAGRHRALRPLVGARTSQQRHDAVAIVFVRDLLGRNAAAVQMLRELFAL